ncbi:MAG: spore germination protein [Firmicutes bacterium HGW-Firmicutes-1]|jgi:spore germination protein|nr:MAG: spore germination protein [Firmicutes bacterium HGW-Firmicutes-1]
MKSISSLHNKETNKIELDLMKSLDENIKVFEALFNNCDDVIKKKFQIGELDSVWGYISYVDSMVNRKVVEDSILEQIIEQIKNVPKNISENLNLFEFVKSYAISTADVKELFTFDEACLAVLSGDTIMFIDGFDKGLLIATKGWPNRGVQEPDTEGVVRGSKEGFSEALRINTVLVRRRIRDTKLKVRQEQVGTRSRTDIAIMYIEDLARKEVLKEIDIRLHSFTIDAIFESGMLEEIMEKEWKSPFPRAQVTQRPDKVASALLEGRVAIVVDNTPFVLLLPTTINCFFQSSEDYYQGFLFSSFVRVLRYVSAAMAVALPGLYIALTCFHTAMIPPELVYSIAAARQGVPFPTIIEVLIIELEFEFLREAAVRLPGSIGSTISIVGGLVIGQAAVAANIVSPIIIVIVAITAIASFSIPNYTLANAYRVVKYWIILGSSMFGLYGFWICILVVLIHLVSLKSVNFPYLMPFVSGDINGDNDLKDSFFRFPVFYYTKRPIFTRKGEKLRFKVKHK